MNSTNLTNQKYNNIYVGSYKYLKEKKIQTEDLKKKAL